MPNSRKSIYESRNAVQFGSRLGIGRDGEVYVTDHNTAVKFLTERESYERERNVYQALARAGELRMSQDMPCLTLFARTTN
jgi:hypothetical protein